MLSYILFLILSFLAHKDSAHHPLTDKAKNLNSAIFTREKSGILNTKAEVATYLSVQNATIQRNTHGEMQ
jgi:hypothetical protein